MAGVVNVPANARRYETLAGILQPSEETHRTRFHYIGATLFHAEALRWRDGQPLRSVHAVVTHPPYGLHEYSPEQQRKLRDPKGGEWRIPPPFFGHRKSPLPRLSTRTPRQLAQPRNAFPGMGSPFAPETRSARAAMRLGRHRARPLRGGGSTLAAAEFVAYASTGLEIDVRYF